MDGFGRVRARALIVVTGWSLLAIGSSAPAGAAGPGVTTMSAGAAHACAVRIDRTVWCWGSAADGRLGDGTIGDTQNLRTTPVRVRRGSSALTGVTRVAAGASFTCALRANGTVWCWGNGDLGQLGDGTTGDPTNHGRLKPVRVLRPTEVLTGVRRVEGGSGYACAVRVDKGVWCWGSNQFGQSGRGSRDRSAHPYPRKVVFP